MDYVDRILIRLADDRTRSALFDAASLRQLVAATYDIESMPVKGPYRPVFDEVRLGYTPSPPATLEGTWNTVGTPERAEARLQLGGLEPTAAPRVDALWLGAVVARTSAGVDRVTSVQTAWPNPTALDAEIVDDLGSLPEDVAVLEQERRAHLLAQIRASLGSQTGFPEALLDSWLEEAGAESVGEWVERSSDRAHGGAVQIAYAPPAPATAPTALPVAVAILIRDVGFGLADLLGETQVVRQRVASLGLEPAADSALRVRHPIVVAWIVPAGVFDEDGWPGGERATTPEGRRDARRAAAGKWLAREGIGLVVTDTPE